MVSGPAGALHDRRSLRLGDVGPRQPLAILRGRLQDGAGDGPWKNSGNEAPAAQTQLEPRRGVGWYGDENRLGREIWGSGTPFERSEAFDRYALVTIRLKRQPRSRRFDPDSEEGIIGAVA
jgi:hypothetical protein